MRSCGMKLCGMRSCGMKPWCFFRPPQVLNTWSLRLTGEAGVQEKLEDVRVAASRSSPMMEIVNLVRELITFTFGVGEGGAGSEREGLGSD